MMMTNDSKPTLVYVGDPMCSWCYGIAPELEKVIKHFGDDLNYEIVLGGLRPYNTQKMPELKEFLKEHWEHVHAASGQQFTYDILDDNTLTYDTEPPCRAVVAVRQIDDSKAFDFFKLTQEAFYYNNKNMHKAESYYDALDNLKIDKEKFTQLFQSSDLKTKVKNDFSRASQLGVSSFPTILLKVDDDYKRVANGYAQATDMIEKIIALKK